MRFDHGEVLLNVLYGRAVFWSKNLTWRSQRRNEVQEHHHPPGRGSSKCLNGHPSHPYLLMLGCDAAQSLIRLLCWRFSSNDRQGSQAAFGISLLLPVPFRWGGNKPLDRSSLRRSRYSIKGNCTGVATTAKVDTCRRPVGNMALTMIELVPHNAQMVGRRRQTSGTPNRRRSIGAPAPLRLTAASPAKFSHCKR